VSSLLYVDVIGGAAGDMLLAALLDAGAPISAVRDAVEAVLPGRFAIEAVSVKRGGMRAQLLRIEGGPDGPDAERLEPRSFQELVAAVDRANLLPPVAAGARSVLDRLGQAEARIHGSVPSELQLHQLGDDDTLLDVVGVAAALDELEIEEVLVSTVPLEAEGTLPAWGDHPAVPLPAPVTLELLRGFRTRAGGAGEIVTPTAAAIFAALGAPTDSFPEMTIGSIGYGAGTRDPPDRPNLVRVVVGSRAAQGSPARELVVMEANIDDLTPELMADAVQALFAAGALDAWTTPIHMKKGRSGILLSAIGESDAELRLRTTFFEATSTFGVRSHRVTRAELERRIASVELTDGSVRVKVGLLEGRVITATPEHDDVAALAARTGRPVRLVYEEAATAALALRYAASDR
jgi:hypothetical protein